METYVLLNNVFSPNVYTKTQMNTQSITDDMYEFHWLDASAFLNPNDVIGLLSSASPDSKNSFARAMHEVWIRKFEYLANLTYHTQHRFQSETDIQNFMERMANDGFIPKQIPLTCMSNDRLGFFCNVTKTWKEWSVVSVAAIRLFWDTLFYNVSTETRLKLDNLCKGIVEHLFGHASVFLPMSKCSSCSWTLPHSFMFSSNTCEYCDFKHKRAQLRPISGVPVVCVPSPFETSYSTPIREQPKQISFSNKRVPITVLKSIPSCCM